MKRLLPILAAIALALGLFAGAVTLTSAAAPSPVANLCNSSYAPRYPLAFFNAQRLTADGKGASFYLPNYCRIDWAYYLDMGTGVPNTTTLQTLYSIDGSHWITSVGSFTTSATGWDMVQVGMFGLYVSVYADTSNSTPITLTVTGIAR